MSACASINPGIRGDLVSRCVVVAPAVAPRPARADGEAAIRDRHASGLAIGAIERAKASVIENWSASSKISGVGAIKLARRRSLAAGLSGFPGSWPKMCGTHCSRTQQSRRARSKPDAWRADELLADQDAQQSHERDHRRRGRTHVHTP